MLTQSNRSAIETISFVESGIDRHCVAESPRQGCPPVSISWDMLGTSCVGFWCSFYSTGSLSRKIRTLIPQRLQGPPRWPRTGGSRFQRIALYRRNRHRLPIRMTAPIFSDKDRVLMRFTVMPTNFFQDCHKLRLLRADKTVFLSGGI